MDVCVLCGGDGDAASLFNAADEEHRIALMEQHDEDTADLSLIDLDDDRADLLPYWLTTRVAERTVVAIILVVCVGWDGADMEEIKINGSII